MRIMASEISLRHLAIDDRPACGSGSIYALKWYKYSEGTPDCQKCLRMLRDFESGKKPLQRQPMRGEEELEKKKKRKEFYDEYMLSEEWAKVSEEAKERAGYCCQLCNSSYYLQVHHRTYENIGHELPGDLTVLCRTCHQEYHAREREKRKREIERCNPHEDGDYIKY